MKYFVLLLVTYAEKKQQHEHKENNKVTRANHRKKCVKFKPIKSALYKYCDNKVYYIYVFFCCFMRVSRWWRIRFFSRLNCLAKWRENSRGKLANCQKNQKNVQKKRCLEKNLMFERGFISQKPTVCKRWIELWMICSNKVASHFNSDSVLSFVFVVVRHGKSEFSLFRTMKAVTVAPLKSKNGVELKNSLFLW